MPIAKGVSVCPLKPYTAGIRCRSAYIKAGMGSRRICSSPYSFLLCRLRKEWSSFKNSQQQGRCCEAAYIREGTGSQRVSPHPNAFRYSDCEGSEVPSKTLSCMDAAAKPPWKGSRRVFDGASLPKLLIAGIKKAHLSALFWAYVAKSRLV
jgi:hypothetical protein